MLSKQSTTAAATHKKLLSNRATKINQQMKDRLIRLLIVQIQQDVQQKEDSAYATQTQTCALQNTIRDTGTANTNQIIAKLDAMQNQALLDKIDALREKNSQQAVVINNAQQTAAFGQMIGQATSPIVAAVNALQSDVNGIKCKLPETVTLPYSCATAVPTQAVFNGYALGTYAGWNGCGCNNSLWG